MNSWALKQSAPALVQNSWQKSMRDGFSLLLPNVFAYLIIVGIAALFLILQPELWAMQGMSPHQSSSVGTCREEWHMTAHISHPWVTLHHLHHNVFLPNARGLNWPQCHFTDIHEVQPAGITTHFQKSESVKSANRKKNFYFFAIPVHFRSYFLSIDAHHFKFGFDLEYKRF